MAFIHEVVRLARARNRDDPDAEGLRTPRDLPADMAVADDRHHLAFDRRRLGGHAEARPVALALLLQHGGHAPGERQQQRHRMLGNGRRHASGRIRDGDVRQPDRFETFAARGEEMHPAHRVARRRQGVDHRSRLVGRRIVEDQRLRASQRGEQIGARFHHDDFGARHGVERRDDLAPRELQPCPIDDAHRRSLLPVVPGGAGRRNASSSMSEPQPGRVGTSSSPFSSVEGCVRKSRVHGASSARSSMMRKFGIAAQKCALIRLARSPTGLCGATWVSNASASVATRTDCQTPFHIGSTIAVSTARSTR